jgi:hypothetical protein
LETNNYFFTEHKEYECYLFLYYSLLPNWHIFSTESNRKRGDKEKSSILLTIAKHLTTDLFLGFILNFN